MAWSHDPREGIRLSGESSKTTHRLRICIDACRYLGGLIIGALNGVDKNTLLSACYCPVEGLWVEKPLEELINKIATGSFKEMDPPLIRGNGYVIKSLEAALWAFYKSTIFEEGALLAVNLGEDADTTGAVYGQLAGAFYGESGIPGKWLCNLTMRETISEMADKLAKYRS
jgi:ADP-ribosylglycohydrolase